MGLLKHLLAWPVTGPLFLTEFALKSVHESALAELMDEGRIKEGLLELQLRLELGEIDEEQYVEEESALIERLRQAREWRERLNG